MRKLKVPPKEVSKLFYQEWKRIKKLCKPLLDNKTKPRFYLAKTLHDNWIGSCSHADFHKVNGRWLSGDLILIREDHLSSPRLLSTIRHEICHVLHHNHKANFKLMLRGLDKEKASLLENAQSLKAN